MEFMKKHRLNLSFHTELFGIHKLGQMTHDTTRIHETTGVELFGIKGNDKMIHSYEDAIGNKPNYLTISMDP
jgi:hypothetical protein